MFNKWLNKKVKPGKDVLAITKDKNLDVIHSRTETLKRKKQKKQFRKEKRLQEINERQQIKDINKHNKTPKGSSDLKNLDGNIIDIKDVEKIYTTKRLRFVALQKTSFSIIKGDFVVILGPSGSGKTTLLNIISGLDRATDGDVIVDDINLSALTEKQMTFFRRKNIGFIFQSYNLLSSLNVVDNIEVGAILQKDKNKRQDTLQILKMLGIENISKKNIYELSGGQQQRVSIARALAKNPKILIGDEPTGALDEETTTKVLRIFQNINKQTGTTVIIVTHNSDIAKLANQVIYVKDGFIEKIKTLKR